MPHGAALCVMLAIAVRVHAAVGAGWGRTMRAALPSVRASRSCCARCLAQPLSFEQYTGQLPEWLLTRTKELGFVHPTAVQQCAIEPLLQRNDTIILAQTGSGKTLAYLLPLIAQLRSTSSVQAGPLPACPARSPPKSDRLQLLDDSGAPSAVACARS